MAISKSPCKSPRPPTVEGNSISVGDGNTRIVNRTWPFRNFFLTKSRVSRGVTPGAKEPQTAGRPLPAAAAAEARAAVHRQFRSLAILGVKEGHDIAAVRSRSGHAHDQVWKRRRQRV